MRLAVRLASLVVLAAATAAADMPDLAGDGWHRWQVDAAASVGSLCCVETRGGVVFGRGCTLDPDNYVLHTDEPGTPSGGLAVYARMEDGRVTTLRAYGARCPVDASGPLADHGIVATNDSVAWLAGLLDREHTIAPEAVMILSLHDGARARETVIATGHRHPDAELRSNAWFWLAESGAAESEYEIGIAVREDPDRDVREEAVFALSQLPADRAAAALAGLIRNRELPMPVRENALFWLAQSDSDEAVAVFDDILGAN